MFLLHARIPSETVHLRRSGELVRGIGRPAVRGRSDEEETIHADALPEGVLDKGVSRQPDYILSPDYWAMKIQDRRLPPVSGWDSPLRGRQARLPDVLFPFYVTNFVQP